MECKTTSSMLGCWINPMSLFHISQLRMHAMGERNGLPWLLKTCRARYLLLRENCERWRLEKEIEIERERETGDKQKH